jgi:hypothetical protein
MSKIQYDPQSKILSVRTSDAKSADSQINDNIVFDYDRKLNL